MTDSSSTLISRAIVTTDKPARYGKQLASHMGRKVPFSWDEEAGSGTVDFADGAVPGTLTSATGSLELQLQGDPELLDRFEHVLGIHLVRFGAREGLECAWSRSDGSPATKQTPADLDD